MSKKLGSHRVIARKVPETKELHDELGLAREKIAEIQQAVDRYVNHAVELLQMERNTELEATQLELDAAPSAETDTAVKSPTEYIVHHVQTEQEQCDTICNLIAVSSSTGLRRLWFNYIVAFFDKSLRE